MILTNRSSPVLDREVVLGDFQDFVGKISDGKINLRKFLFVIG